MFGLSLRNIGDQVQLISIHELNAYDVLCSDIVVFSKDTIELSISMFKGEHIDLAFVDVRTWWPFSNGRHC
jgi:hypothetical protein